MLDPVAARTAASASRTGTSGSAVALGPQRRRPRRPRWPSTGRSSRRSDRAARRSTVRQPARSPDASRATAQSTAEPQVIGHQPDGLGERRRGPVEMAALGVQADQGVPDGSVERSGAGRLGVGGLGPVPLAPLLPGVAPRRRIGAEEDRVQPRRRVRRRRAAELLQPPAALEPGVAVEHADRAPLVQLQPGGGLDPGRQPRQVVGQRRRRVPQPRRYCDHRS